MTASKGKVIYLHQRDPLEALERLNRITGLHFSCWPQSLCSDQERVPQPSLQPTAGTDNLPAASQGSTEVLSG